MSDVSQGLGWWQAADGKWYPPEQHPSLASSTSGGSSPSDVRGGPPPPVVPAAAPVTGGQPGGWVVSQAPGGPTPAAPPAAPVGAPSLPAPPGPAPAPPAKQTRRRWASFDPLVIMAFAAALALIGGVLFFFAANTSKSSGHTATTVPVGTATTVPGGTATTAPPATTTTPASPVPTAQALVAAYSSGDFTRLCVLVVPAQVPQCAGAASQLTKEGVTGKGLSLGDVSVDGAHALVVLVGSECVPGDCVTNHDTRAATDQGRSFASEFAYVVSPRDTSPWVVPLELQSGKWYIVGFGS